jgi:hypothetical protein
VNKDKSGKSLSLKFATLLASVCFLSGCSTSLPTDASSQLDYACAIINGWPVDYATVWPNAVKSHNASPDTVSAADYMTDYIQAASDAFKIDEPEALDLIERYKWSWVLLEMDLINGGGVLRANPTFSGKAGELMQYCDDSGRGFKP